MKYLKKFNESRVKNIHYTRVEEQIYTQVLDRIRECFLEFEDNGWHWIALATAASSIYTFINPSISIWKNPNFNCRMIPKEEAYQPSDRRDLLDWTGEINSDGEITWNTKELKGHNLTKVDSDNNATWSMSEEKQEFKEGSKEREEAEDFLVAVKRLQSEIGIGFKFSYNNSGGEKRIVIQGSI
jgi:hypothetical protein